MGKGRDLPQEFGEVELSGHSVRYRLRRTNRRTVGLTVDAAEGLVVHSPKRLSRRELERVLNEKSRWILSKTAWAADQRRRLATVRWQPGHAFPYRGESLTLALRMNGAGPRLTAEGEALVLTLPSQATPQPDQLRAHLLDAYREAAREVIAMRLPLYAARLGTWPRQWRIKSQRRRWGSCSPRGILNFNWRLILAPPGVLDYVVAHELSHLRHPDHSPRFWAEVERICPDHAVNRRWLRMHGETLFIDEIPAEASTLEEPPAAEVLPPPRPAEADSHHGGTAIMPPLPSKPPSPPVQQSFSGMLLAALPLASTRRARKKRRTGVTIRQMELL